MAASADGRMDENEWELSKENILPLRGGRVISDLTQALRPSADRMAMVKQQIEKFEIELMTYRGDDPLDIWTRYINWLQQTFPKGGKESHIDDVLHKCVTSFKGDHRFDNDPRYLAIWIKFANICKDPLEIYKYMFDNKIGYKLASFYEAWASELEHVGNTKKADTVYLQGLENGAEPLELLRQRQSELHTRVARRVAGEIVAPPEPVTVVEEPRRHALGALKGRRSGMVAPIERASSAAEAGVRIPQQGVAPAANHRQFQILNDENADPSSLMQATGQYRNIPAKVTHKENTQAAGVWANKKVKQRNVPVVKLSEITTVSKPEFSVFTDEEEATLTPQGKPIIESRALSARKPDSCQDLFYRFTHTANEPGIMVMYPKDKVYCGGMEFQLEEIRAYKWMEVQRQAEERRIKEEIERERELIRLEREQLENERALLEQQRRREQAELIRPRSTNVEGSFQSNKSVPSAAEASILQASVIDSTVELLGLNNVFDQRAAAGMVNASSAMPNITANILSSAGSSQSLHEEMQNVSLQAGLSQSLHEQAQNLSSHAGSSQSLHEQTQNLSSHAGSSQSLHEQTQNTSSHATPNSGSMDTTKDSLTATIHTKQALSTILGMFNQTIDLHNEFGWKTNENTEPMETEPRSDTIPTAATGCQFQIYEESSEAPVKENKNWPVSAVSAGQQASQKTALREKSLEMSQQRQLSVEMLQQRQPASEISHQRQLSVEMSQQRQPLVEKSEQRQSAVEVSQQRQPLVEKSEQRQLSMDPFQQKQPSVEMSRQRQPSLQMSQQDLSQQSELSQKRQLSHRMSQHSQPSLEMSQQKQPAFSMSKQRHPSLEMSQQKQPSLNMSQQRHPSLEMSQQKQSSLNMSQQRQSSLGTSQQRQPLFSVYCEDEHDGSDSVFERADNKHLGLEEDMEGVENLPSETTFLPALSSTRNFTGLVQNGHSFLPFEDASNMGDGQKLSVSDVKSDRTSESVTSENTASNSQMKSGDAKRQSNVFGELSPIIECSDEDIKGQVTTSSTAMSSSSCLSSNMSRIPKMAESLHSTNNDTRMALSKKGQDLDGNTFHLINTNNYEPPENDNKLKEMLEQSIAIDPNDPFDTDLIDTFLARLPHPLTDLPNCHSLTEMMPDIVVGKTICLGKHKYHIKKHLAQGAFAKVYLVERKLASKKSQQEVMKVQKPACLWEFYICTELSARLQNLNLSRDVRPGIMSINEGYFYINGSCMTTTHHQHGTLLDVVNNYRSSGYRLPPAMLTLLVLDLLYIMEMMHKCHIIHGDIKPDNILLINIPDTVEVPDDLSEFLDQRPLLIKLIDFGQSIDMKMFPEGTTFTVSVETSGFKCIEMKTNRPWTYQTDLFGLIGTIHLLYFLKYMNVYQNNGEWRTTSKFKRNPESEILQKMFSDMMSIPSCTQLPDLSQYRKQLEALFIETNKARAVRTSLVSFKNNLGEN